jgi:hypothetical protein
VSKQHGELKERDMSVSQERQSPDVGGGRRAGGAQPKHGVAMPGAIPIRYKALPTVAVSPHFQKDSRIRYRNWRNRLESALIRYS